MEAICLLYRLIRTKNVHPFNICMQIHDAFLVSMHTCIYIYIYIQTWKSMSILHFPLSLYIHIYIYVGRERKIEIENPHLYYISLYMLLKTHRFYLHIFIYRDCTSALHLPICGKNKIHDHSACLSISFSSYIYIYTERERD